ncbi:zinc-dependent alcohol dehydrogenase family protein [Pectobacterium odoriferum]|uniref:zinc-dependent alcohol dehydrogenase family protein n=1 Tax=Pectobacterium odoriferum TaxID=78398 RepID=UPI000CD059A7|nr:zinc-dependent alcohol dehydrogenase family protein [Pectobacterium odoriferum]MBA0187171.1 zinc-dependent alcohol dehydrogenase family protein [Pectobacterium odoriferum]POE03421.1 quinone oxidoreductase [Pectobacterium odoriferum]
MSTNIMMRAQVLEDYAIGKLTEQQVIRPNAGKGQVLVRIIASGVNPIDGMIRTGTAPYAMPELPAILGTDLAGIVESVGDGVSRFKPGDEVYGLTGGVRGLPGSLAEYAAVDADLLAHKPKNLDMREAAAIPLVFLTAWEGLVDAARIQAGQRVLVQGGAGGVGHMAVQLARAHGAKVFATASAAKQAIVESLGATFIDYRKSTVQDYLDTHTAGQGFDIIYDTVGGKVLDDSMLAVRPYGHIASCYAFAEHNLAAGSLRCMTLSGVFVLLPMLSGLGRSHHGNILREATRLAEAGQLKPVLDPRRFSLSDAQAAQEAQKDGSAVGKLIIDVYAAHRK